MVKTIHVSDETWEKIMVMRITYNVKSNEQLLSKILSGDIQLENDIRNKDRLNSNA